MRLQPNLLARALALSIVTAFVGCTCGPADKVAPAFDGAAQVTVVDDFTLNVAWAPATDDVSKPEQLTYAVYSGLAADAIDLTTPLATSAPGASAHDVSGLAAGTTYFFIVRARDAAGNEDANEVVVSGTTTFNGQLAGRQLGSFMLTGSIRRAITAGNRMYLALGGAGIEIDDITDPPTPIRLSTLEVGDSANDAAIEPLRQLLYVADATRGLTIVDVKDSAAPALMSTFDPGLGSAVASAVAANQDYAYLAAGNELFVIDVMAPTAPDFAARVPMANAVLTMALDGDTLFTLHQGGALSAWDVASPGPVLLGTWAGPADARALAVDQGRAYLASPSTGVQVVSFAAPSAPALLGTVGSAAFGVAVEGQTLAVSGDKAFYTWDLSDLAAPKVLTANPVVTTPDVVGVSRGLGIYIYRAAPRINDGSTSLGVILNIPPFAWYASPGARTDVPANTPVYFYFSKPMDPASLTAGSLTVRDGSGPVAGALAFDWYNTRLVFTPAAALSAQTTYTVALSSELKDTRGDSLWPSTGLSYSFTTAAPVPPPSTPGWLSAIPQDRYVSLSWPWVPGASWYVVYWSTAPGVTAASNRAVTYGRSWYHSGLTNGQPYHYRVAAASWVGESALSDEVQATPIPPPPPQPVATVWASPANQRVTLSWYSVYGATRYNVYWSTTPNAPMASRTRVSSVGRPWVHAGLNNGTPYYYVVTAENSGGESAPSPEVTATPYAPPVPGQVTGLWAQGGDARVSLGWNWVSGASWYDVYAAASPGQLAALPASARVGRAYGTGFTHWGLFNNQPYYYVVVAVNDGGAGPASVEVSALPVPPPLPDAPTDVHANGGDRRATVYWTGAPWATRYNVYWSTTPGVTAATGQKVSYARSPFTHGGLINGQTYFYVVTAENSAGESAESDEVAVTPLPPPIPAAPINFTASPRDRAVSLFWNSVPGATRYTIYFSTSPNVDQATASKLYTSYRSYSHSNLTNGTTYYYKVTASNSGGESLPSSEVSATPVAPPAPTSAPLNVTGSPGDARNYVWWSGVSGASWYNVYWSTSPGVTAASNKAAHVWPTWSHWNLTNGTTYYYRVSAENTGGEGPLSAEVALTPQLPPPPITPTGVSVRAGDRRNDLSWNYVSGATWYDVYWSTAPGVTQANSRIRTYYSRYYNHYNLTNGQQYCYAVVAGNNGGESALSQEVCGTPQPPPAPSGAPSLTAVPLDASTRLSWTQVQGATLYYVYFKSGAGVTKQNGTRLGVGRYGPYVHYGLTNGTSYCYVAAAVNSGGEGPASAETCVTPTQPPAPGTPTQFYVTPGNGLVRAYFGSVQNALQYNLYWSTQAGVTPATGTKIAGVYTGYTHAGLTNGTPYYYVVTALNSTGESAPTAEASATPSVPQVPAAPQNVNATPGNGQVMVEWGAVQGATSYTLYWSTAANVSKQTYAGRFTFAQSPYTHTGRINGTAYYYVVTASNGNGEGPESAVVSATPQVALPNAPQNLVATAGDGQVTLTWSAVQGATGYNLYWGTQAGVSKASTRISSVTSGYVHTGRTNGTACYYAVTAQNAGGESPVSLEAQATPSAPSISPPTWQSVTASSSAVTLAWNPVQGATSYNVYWAQGTTVSKSSGTQLAGVTSPYVHSGRSNGTIYAYVVTAVGPGGESAESQVRTATPSSQAAPTTFNVSAGYHQVGLQMTGGTGVRRYNVYWSTTSGVTPQTGARLSFSSGSGQHLGLTTGQTYYYVATYTNDTGESLPTTERSATPIQPVNPVLTGQARDGSTYVYPSSSTPGAYAATLYWSLTTPVNKQTANAVTLPPGSPYYTHTGLTNGTPVYYLLSLSYPEGVRDSAEVSVTPAAPLVSTPTINSGVAGYRNSVVYWSAPTAPLSWNLYWATAPGVTTSSNAVVVPATSTNGSWVHPALTTGQTYYYRVEGVYASGSSSLSNEYVLTPGLPAPTGVYTERFHQQNRVWWTSASGATSYRLYWSTTTGVNKTNGTLISGVASPALHSGLTNGQTYYYVVTAVYDDGESAESAQVSAVPSPLPPTGVSATGTPGALTVSWSPTLGATGYNLYYSTSSTVTQATGTRVASVTSPHTVTGLTPGTQYYAVVTALYGATESSDSSRVNAYARLGAPGYLSANGTAGGVDLYWGGVTGATGYNLYWSTAPGVTPSTGTRISLGAVNTYRHTPLPNGAGLYYVVTATDGTNESAPNTTVAYGLPGMYVAPSLSARAGDQTVDLTLSSNAGSSFAVYSSTSPTVSPSTGTRVAVGTSWRHAGLTNGTSLYYVATLVGPGGDEGPPSAVVAATPSARAPAVVVHRVDATSVTLGIEQLPGATQYNVYWGTSAGVTKATGTPVSDVYSGTAAYFSGTPGFSWQHVALTPGTQLYWVATAVGPSGESAVSAEVTASPRAGPGNLQVNATGAGASFRANLTWDAVAGATGYRVYCGPTPDARGASLCASSTTNQATWEFQEGWDLRYFQVTALEAAGESGPSSAVAGRFFTGAPPMPVLNPGGAGDGVAVLSWAVPSVEQWSASVGMRATSWKLYYGTSTGVTPQNGTLLSDVSPVYAHTGLTNGTTYYYVLVATNPLGDSPPSAEVAVTPVAGASGSWTSVGGTGSSGRAVNAPALAVRSTTPYVFAGLRDDKGRFRLRGRTFGGTSWADYGAELNLDSESTVLTQRAVADSTHVYLAYTETTGVARRPEVIVQRNDGAGWSRMGATFNTRAAVSLDVRLVDGTPHVLYAEQASTGEYQLFARSFGGSAWSLLGGALTASGQQVYSGQLAAQGTAPVAAFLEGASSGSRTPRVLRFAGTSWATMTLPAAASGGSPSAIAVASSGQNVYVGLTSLVGTRYVLEVFHASADTFVQLGGPVNLNAADSATQASLAVVGSTLHASFLDTAPGVLAQAVVSRWTGAAWQQAGAGLRYTGGYHVASVSNVVDGAGAPWVYFVEHWAEFPGTATGFARRFVP
jgi:fibronectin type 3 domain-containing protein